MSQLTQAPLARKLGLRASQRVLLRSAPDDFVERLGTLPEELSLLDRARLPVDLIIAFFDRRQTLFRALPRLKQRMKPDAGLWLAWPKKSSAMHTDLDFGQVQSSGLDLGLVDNKVCAIDDDWSALRFVYRRSDRESLA